MRRLIDANTNREKFKEIVYRTLNDCNITTKKKLNIIMTAFDNMPTAYDIEKVVAELEERRSEYEVYAENAPDEELRAYRKGVMRGCEYSQDIVRKGGVE